MSRGITLQPDEGIRDKIQYKVKTDRKGIKVKVEYKEEYQDEVSGTTEADISEIATQFSVHFDSIVEYAKPNSEQSRSDYQQAYDWDQDVILQTILLTEWQNFTTVENDDTGILSYFSARSLDDVAMFNFTISRADIGENANANTMKIDVLISDFPWIREDSNLALMSTVDSKLKVKMDYNEVAAVDDEKRKKTKWTREVRIDFNEATTDIGFVPTGDYSWQEAAEAAFAPGYGNVTIETHPKCFNQSAFVKGQSTAEILPECAHLVMLEDLVPEDTNSIRVVATSPPQGTNDTFQIIAYSFVGSAAQNASQIYWDPEAGISYSAAWGSAFSALFSIGSAMAVTVVIFVAV